MDKQKNILIIEDEPRMRSLFSRQLKEEGYSVVEAEDGIKALNFLSQNKDMDLIILDIGLPKSSGIDIFETLKRELPNTKILISSIYLKEEQKFFIENADGYYYKSDNILVLIGKVKSLLYGEE